MVGENGPRCRSSSVARKSGGSFVDSRKEVLRTAEFVRDAMDAAQLADQLAGQIQAEVAKLRPGMPWDESAMLPPSPEDGKVEDMQERIQEAVSQGAWVINSETGGGESFHSLMHAAIVDGVRPGMRLYDEETFGPIVTLCRYSDVEQMVERDAHLETGQQASVWGPNRQTKGSLSRDERGAGSGGGPGRARPSGRLK